MGRFGLAPQACDRRLSLICANRSVLLSSRSRAICAKSLRLGAFCDRPRADPGKYCAPEAAYPYRAVRPPRGREEQRKIDPRTFRFHLPQETIEFCARRRRGAKAFAA